MRGALCFVFCVFVTLLSLQLSAAPEREGELIRLQQLLDQQQAVDVDSEKEKRSLLKKTINALKSQQQLEARILSLQAELEAQPKVLAALEGQLNKQLLTSHELPAIISNDELDKLETNTNARLLELNRAMAEYRQAEAQSEVRQQSIREQLARPKIEDQSIDKQLSSDHSELAAQLQTATFAEHNLRQQALELELLVLPKRAEIAKINGQILDKQRTQLSLYLDELVELKQARQRAEAEETLRALEKSATEDSDVAVIQLFRQENQQLTRQLRAVLTRIETFDQQRREEQLRLSQLTTSFSLIRQQLELEVSHITPDQIQFIFENRALQDTGKIVQQIAQLRLQKAQLEQSLNQLNPISISESKSEELSQAQQKRLASLIEDQQLLFEQLNDAYKQLSSSLNQILSVQRQINQQINSNRESITRHLLWNPVTPELDQHWLREISVSSGQVLERWKLAATQALIVINEKTPGRVVVFILVILAVLWLGRYARHRRPLWAKQIGNVVHDRLMHTFKLVLLGPLLTCYLPALVFILATNLVNPSHPDSEQVTAMFKVVAILGWFFLTMREWLRTPDGLFCLHFGVNDELCLLLRRLSVWVIVICIPLIMFHAYIWDIDSDEMRSGLVRFVIFLLLGAIVVLLFRLWRFVPQINQITRSKSWWLRAELWLTVLMAVNLSLIVLTGLGYTFTVNLIIYAGFQLAFLLLLTFIFFKLGMRLVLISERRLEFDRAKTRRAEILAARENPDEEPPLETNYLNMQTISDHSRTLLKTATAVVLFMLIWGGMGGYLPLFGVLDNVELWSSIGSDGETAFVTLKAVIFGVVVLALCLLAAYNLPGLLELLILRNLELTPGTGYAITSLIKYALIMIGVLVAFSSFGLEWGKLQWLVAALGVGLGFGLQEIVANFVSGLIILFEKPVRIGDTVTIDGLTGTVTRIQIRATTITDWDRKEVIIPNKAFITQQLINWSLTDSITRIVVPVGVAYGADTDQARELLLEAAQEEERVLQDPKPEAFFTQFADSSLNLELRFYVSAMADRLEMNHRVNTRVAEKFKRAGIEIAFPQLDVHLKRG